MQIYNEDIIRVWNQFNEESRKQFHEYLLNYLPPVEDIWMLRDCKCS